MTANGNRVSSEGDESILKLDKRRWLCNMVNVFDTTGLYTLKWLKCYVYFVIMIFLSVEAFLEIQMSEKGKICLQMQKLSEEGRVGVIIVGPLGREPRCGRGEGGGRRETLLHFFHWYH